MKKKQQKSNTMNARWMKVNFLNFSVADIDIYWLLLFGVFFKKVSSIGKFPSIGKMTLNVISQVWLTPCNRTEKFGLIDVSDVIVLAVLYFHVMTDAIFLFWLIRWRIEQHKRKKKNTNVLRLKIMYVELIYLLWQNIVIIDRTPPIFNTCNYWLHTSHAWLN